MFYRFDRPDPTVSPDPFKACVVPRPIGWISTVDAAGVRNLAPFSFFNAINEEPPMVMFCANGQHVEGGEKDSVKNARETGEFVVNLATWDIYGLPSDDPAEIGRMVMGRVLGIHIAEDVIIDGRVSAARLRPIARLGYREYAVIDEVFKMTRPSSPP
jgi:flavin reductase (DIM6/NTAB) family NADH-FMN oxidoreductase RutF